MTPRRRWGSAAYSYMVVLDVLGMTGDAVPVCV